MQPSRYHKIRVIDSHTEGEPTRLVLDGFPDLGNGTMAERLTLLREQHDDWRKAIILEPRGNDILVGALLCPPQNPKATAGVIFFNNEDYLGMCGHGTIGLMASLHYLGLADVGEHLVETPVGDVTTVIHADGSVSINNVASYRYREAVTLDVPGLGPVTGDIAWGGNWFFLVSQKFTDIDLRHVKALTEISLSIKDALAAQNITGKDGALIDHIELFQPHASADSQSFVLCPGGAYDRSPCGTGTSAKLACLAADGKLAEGDVWVQASVIGSQFQASYQRVDATHIIPTIQGHAYICADNTVLIDANDPFQWGIVAK
ncbi:MAG: 4-hydroxyproline epimerase [Neisseriaceae bacterium]|nr:4-hydroxyproline epimerase [Neisseriaceae bacterium]